MICFFCWFVVWFFPCNLIDFVHDPITDCSGRVSGFWIKNTTISGHAAGSTLNQQHFGFLPSPLKVFLQLKGKGNVMSFFKKLFGGKDKADNSEKNQERLQESDEEVIAEELPEDVVELSGLEKVISKFESSVSENEIITRYELIKEHTSNLFARASQFTDVIPQDFLNKCIAIFEKNQYGVLENFIECEMGGTAKHFSYQDDGDEIYFVVSPMPWTKDEAVDKLSETSDEPPFGYMNLFSNLINNRPSADLTNFMQLLICSGGGMFELHVCLAQMRSKNPQDGYEFTLYPTELLNPEEQSIAGL
jgi:hypothetical protein